MTTTPAPERIATLIKPLDDTGKNGVIRITASGKTSDYSLSAELAPRVRVFVLTKWDGRTSYTVRYDGTRILTCTCPGFQFNRRCKHLEGIISLVRSDAFFKGKRSGEPMQLGERAGGPGGGYMTARGFYTGD